MKRRIVELHEDGTVTCWRPALRQVRRGEVVMSSGGWGLTARDLAAMRRIDRERVVAAHPELRALTSERTLVRARLDFVIALPLGSALPSPTIEAVEAAALAIAGPTKILPGARVAVGRASSRVSRRRAR
jgi:hypothetical protein